MTYEMCWPQVPHPAQQVEGAVPHGDEGLVAEEDGLAAVRGLGELGEHDAGHAGLDEDAEHALHAHHHDGGGALGGGGAAPVAAQCGLLVTIPIHRTLPLPDGVLGLHTEQEGRAEVHNIVHTDHVL